MAGEYPLAKQALDAALADARKEPNVDEATFARALMHELLEHYRATRTTADIVSELEDHIRHLEDGDDPVITRGC